MTSAAVDPQMDYFLFELDQLYVIPIYFVSFAVGIPLNGYIIHRLYVRGIKGSYYYKLLMLMSVIDIYIAFFYTVEYYNTGTYHGGTAQMIVLNILNAIQTFFTLIVVVYWKTAVKKKPKHDKILYSVASAHFIQFFIIILTAGLDFYLMTEYNYTLILIQGWIIGATATITFFSTSIVCIYSIVVVLVAETDSYSAQTLRAYKRMAIAHFAQCIIVEIDIISQNFTIAFLFIAVTATSFFYSDAGDTNYERIPGWMHSILKMNVVFLTLNYLVPIIKPFIRAIFIAWALRRLLSTEQKVIIRVQPTSTIRSTTRDN